MINGTVLITKMIVKVKVVQTMNEVISNQLVSPFGRHYSVQTLCRHKSVLIYFVCYS